MALNVFVLCLICDLLVELHILMTAVLIPAQPWLVRTSPLKRAFDEGWTTSESEEEEEEVRSVDSKNLVLKFSRRVGRAKISTLATNNLISFSGSRSRPMGRN